MPHTDLSIECYTVINQCEVASNMARYDGVEYGYKPETGITVEESFSAARSNGFSDVVKNRIVAGNFFLLARYCIPCLYSSMKCQIVGITKNISSML